MANLLAIYLNDHLAGAGGALELVKRSAGSNRGTELGDFLVRLHREIEEDRESLLQIMRGLEIGTDRAKVAAGWLAEKAGRLKLNGSLLRYSPLSRLVELEALTLAVHGKLAGWLTLQQLYAARLREVDLARLIERAERQLEGLERFRLAAAREAFAARAR